MPNPGTITTSPTDPRGQGTRQQRQEGRERWRQRRKGEGGRRGAKPNTTPPYRRAEQQKGHEAREGREETFQAEDEEGGKVEGDRDGETPRGALFEVTRVGGDMPPQRETQTSRDSTQNIRTCC